MNADCRKIWRKDEQEKRNLQIVTEDVMENRDGVLTILKLSEIWVVR